MDMESMHQDPALGMDDNYAFARDYWYIVAGVVAAGTAIHAVERYTSRQRCDG